MRKACILLAAMAAALSAGPAGAQTKFASYTCRDGSLFALAFYPGSRTAYVQLDGKAMQLPRRIAVSGQRYAKNGVTLTMKRDATTLRRGGKSTQCAAEE